MGTQQKKKKRTKDNRAVVAEIKRTQDLDANRLALQPTFEGTAYATIGAGTISFCNVSTSIAIGIQTGTTASEQELWLKFDGDYLDSSTNNNTVDAHNSSGFAGTGKFGTNSVLLNSPSLNADYLQVTDNPSILLDMSVGFSYSFWLYCSITTSPTSIYPMYKTNDSSNGVFTLYTPQTGQLITMVKEAGTNIARQNTMTNNAWNHIVITYNAATNVLELYVNKVAGSTNALSSGVAANTTDLYIGASGNNPSSTNAWVGRIDEFQYFKGTVLTTTQINNLFATNAP